MPSYTRSQLMRAVSDKLGRPVNFSSIVYAQLIGECDKGDKQPDGWFLYSDNHLQQLLKYFKKRAHRARRPAVQS